MTFASAVSTRAAWQRREAAYWATHPHVCHACGRPVDPDQPGEATVHHLSYRWPRGSEPDEVLIGLCVPCHTGRRWMRPSLHTTQRWVSHSHGWMRGPLVTNPARHYRHLWSYSIRWLRWHRFWSSLCWWRDLPEWDAPARFWRSPP